MKLNNLLFYFSSALFLLLGCKKLESTDTKIIYVPDYLKAMIPYTDSQKIKCIGINKSSLSILVQKKSTVISVNSSLYRFAIEKIKRISEKLSDINKPISANLLAVYSLKPTAINNNSRIGF